MQQRRVLLRWLNECGGEEDESFRDGAVDKQLLELSMLEVSDAAGGEDANMDAKAEEFIAKFHAPMKLHRQIS
uniref:Uncharacterized protein n=1 Tax=Oryza punctata TaxID=4537 RepID=A0A0E0K2F8_ORYPU